MTVEPTVPVLGDAARTTAGILLLTLVAVEYGGSFLLRVTRGGVAATEFQRRSFRAGHAHAGVLVLLALTAILMPAGFFLSALGRDVTQPNRLIALVWRGAGSLAAGVTALGVGLLRSAG